MKKKAARAQGKSEKKKKVGGKASMYRADGTAYAPWMVGGIVEDVGSMGVKSKVSWSAYSGKDLMRDANANSLSPNACRVMLWGV